MTRQQLHHQIDGSAGRSVPGSRTVNFIPRASPYIPLLILVPFVTPETDLYLIRLPPLHIIQLAAPPKKRHISSGEAMYWVYHP